MGKLTGFLKYCLPPVLVDGLRQLRPERVGFLGNYTNWDEAEAKASGYDAGVILHKAREAILQVKAGKAAFERDTKLFDTPEYVYPVLAALLREGCAQGGRLRVLDFGGALGSTYFAARRFVGDACQLEWHVVEQPHFVECGRHEVAEGGLRFHHTLEEVPGVDVVLLSSVLQYLKDPYEWIERFAALGARTLIIDRTPFYANRGQVLTVQVVPPAIYEASYPCWLLDEQRIKQVLTQQYRLELEYLNAEGAFVSAGHPLAFRGMIWRKN